MRYGRVFFERRGRGEGGQGWGADGGDHGDSFVRDAKWLGGGTPDSLTLGVRAAKTQRAPSVYRAGVGFLRAS